MSADANAPRRRSKIVFLPILLFALLAALFLAQLLSGRDASEVPSVLIGQPAPATALPPLAGADLPGLNSSAFAGKVTLVNVWASWCAPCREEHPVLVELAKDTRFTLAGLNYKDKPANASKFLVDLGNPYAAIGVDEAGKAGLDWGVYGVPETFVVGRDGTILYKHIGPLTPASLASALMPHVEKALATTN
ncbi:MAG: DsbE family thiol:disulfide interchange protein [Rhizobiaceae bacterium]|nr:DsbE family thiol:disulfide interchange protein [Rhizobiaceae bacterium]